MHYLQIEPAVDAASSDSRAAAAAAAAATTTTTRSEICGQFLYPVCSLLSQTSVEPEPWTAPAPNLLQHPCPALLSLWPWWWW